MLDADRFPSAITHKLPQTSPLVLAAVAVAAVMVASAHLTLAEVAAQSVADRHSPFSP